MAYFTGDAISELKKMKTKEDGSLDMSTLPDFAKRIISVKKPVRDANGKLRLEESSTSEVHRDLGAMVSMLTVAVQQLSAEIDILKGKKDGTTSKE
jgi:hypothetical protein